VRRNFGGIAAWGGKGAHGAIGGPEASTLEKKVRGIFGRVGLETPAPQRVAHR